MGVLDGWRLCPRCGAALELSSGRAECEACGSVYYANSAPAVEGLLERDGKVLLARRAIEPRLGYWDLPGGFLAEGEEAFAGLAREFREETGLEIVPGEWLGTHLEPYDDHFVLGQTWVVRAEGEPRPGDDVGELRFFGPDELPGELAFPHQHEVLSAWRLGVTGRKDGPNGS
jgi:ADP-ribose pyrophosphatase YjhB (NUDIX family)